MDDIMWFVRLELVIISRNIKKITLSYYVYLYFYFEMPV